MQKGSVFLRSSTEARRRSFKGTLGFESSVACERLLSAELAYEMSVACRNLGDVAPSGYKAQRVSKKAAELLGKERSH